MHDRRPILAAALVSLVVSLACALCFYRANCTPIFWHTEGASMEPAIHPGDIEIASVEDFAALKPGEIVIFRPQGHWTDSRFVCHRIRFGFGGRWITRGDNNAHDDPGYLTRENYIATVKMIFHSP